MKKAHLTYLKINKTAFKKAKVCSKKSLPIAQLASI